MWVLYHLVFDLFVYFAWKETLENAGFRRTNYYGFLKIEHIESIGI